MKFGSIPGDVTTDGYKDWIELNSFQMGVGRAIGTAARGAATREASEPNISEIVITKRVDKSSTKLFMDAVAGDLSKSLRAVLSGDYWIGGERVANLVTALNALMKEAAAVPERKTYGLTPRELEVVTCIVEGCSNKDVAKQFAISEETVKRHLSNIFDKTGVSTRLELALFAIAHKLVTLES